MTDTMELTSLTRAKAALPWVRKWLGWVAFMVFMMVIVGGATRLTKSGLSITEWDPIFGVIPPLSDADWSAVFTKYQQSSQYKLQNVGMSLSDFQFIFWWEWAHRLLGRLIGFVFLLPLLFFATTRRLEGRIWPRLIVLFVIGGQDSSIFERLVSVPVNADCLDPLTVGEFVVAAPIGLE